MKKILLILLNIIFVINSLLIIVSYTFKDIFVNGILIETVRARITQVEYKEPNLTLDDVITEKGVITDNELVNEILKSKEIQELINEYMDKIVDTLLDEQKDVSNLDPIELEQSMLEFIKNNKETLSNKTGIIITNEMIDESFEKIDKEDIKKSTIQTILNTKRNLSPKEKLLLKIYKILISVKFRTILWLILGLNVILTMIIEKSLLKWIHTISNLFMVTGILTILFAFGIKKLIASILGEINIYTTPMNRIAIALIILSFIMWITFKLVSVLKGGKHEVSKVSIE